MEEENWKIAKIINHLAIELSQMTAPVSLDYLFVNLKRSAFPEAR